MEITKVSIRLFKDNKLTAFASVEIDRCLVIHNIRIVKSSENKLVVCMPSRKDKMGDFRDIVHPTNKDFRDQLNARVIDGYHKELLNLEKILADSKSTPTV